MTTIRLPRVDVELLKTRLYDEFRIEAPVVEWNGQQFVRVSFQAYNSRQDADALIKALEILLQR
jgi:selenocysteine lyase/cysteine desulfurase